MMHLTYHDENRQGTDDRPAFEIEITPEMIEAGQRAIGESGILYDMETTREETIHALREIYLAMALIAPKPPSASH